MNKSIFMFESLFVIHSSLFLSLEFSQFLLAGGFFFDKVQEAFG